MLASLKIHQYHSKLASKLSSRKRKLVLQSRPGPAFGLPKSTITWQKPKKLYPDQASLVVRLHDGSLEEEATRLTLLSGHGQIKRKDGTSLNIGGSTGGFTRAVLYNCTPPNLEAEYQYQ